MQMSAAEGVIGRTKTDTQHGAAWRGVAWREAAAEGREGAKEK